MQRTLHKTSRFWVAVVVLAPAAVLLAVILMPGPAENENSQGRPAGDESLIDSKRLTVGIVRATMDAGDYTYLELLTGVDQARWVAVPKVRVQVGDRVACVDAEDHGEFYSRTLDRRFESLYMARAAFVVDADGRVISRPDETPPKDR
jgi:hypothetical protein